MHLPGYESEFVKRREYENQAYYASHAYEAELEPDYMDDYIDDDPGMGYSYAAICTHPESALSALLKGCTFPDDPAASKPITHTPTPGTLPSSAGGSAPIHVPDIGNTITDLVLGTSNAIQQAATDVLYKINSIIRQDPVILSPDQYYLLQNSIAIVNTNAVNNFDLIQRSLSR